MAANGDANGHAHGEADHLIRRPGVAPAAAAQWKPRTTLCEDFDSSFGSIAMGQNKLHADRPGTGTITFVVLCVYYALWSIADAVAIWMSQHHKHDACDKPLSLWLLVAGSVGLAHNIACVIALTGDWWDLRRAMAQRPAPQFGVIKPDSFATHLHVWLLRALLFCWVVVGFYWWYVLGGRNVKAAVCNQELARFVFAYCAASCVGWIVTATPLAINATKSGPTVKPANFSD